MRKTLGILSLLFVMPAVSFADYFHSPDWVRSLSNEPKSNAFAGHYPLCGTEVDYTEHYDHRIEIPNTDCDREQFKNHLESYHFTALAYELELQRFEVPDVLLPEGLSEEELDDLQNYDRYLLNLSECGEECPANMQGQPFTKLDELPFGQKPRTIFRDKYNGFKAITFSNKGEEGEAATHCTLAFAGTNSVPDAVVDLGLGKRQIYGAKAGGSRKWPKQDDWNGAQYTAEFASAYQELRSCAQTASSIVIAGHSLGGLLAQHMGALVRMGLSLDGIDTRVDVVTWNAPGARKLADHVRKLPDGRTVEPSAVIEGAKDVQKITFNMYEIEFDIVSELLTPYEKALKLVIHYKDNMSALKTHMRTAIVQTFFWEEGSNPSSVKYGDPLAMRMELSKEHVPCADPCDEAPDYNFDDVAADGTIAKLLNFGLSNITKGLIKLNGRKWLGTTFEGVSSVEGVYTDAEYQENLLNYFDIDLENIDQDALDEANGVEVEEEDEKSRED